MRALQACRITHTQDLQLSGIRGSHSSTATAFGTHSPAPGTPAAGLRFTLGGAAAQSSMSIVSPPNVALATISPTRSAPASSADPTPPHTSSSRWTLPQVQLARSLVERALRAVDELDAAVQEGADCGAIRDDAHGDARFNANSTLLTIGTRLGRVANYIRQSVVAMTVAPVLPAHERVSVASSNFTAIPPFATPPLQMEALYDSTHPGCPFQPALPSDLAIEFFLKDATIICAIYALHFQEGSAQSANNSPAMHRLHVNLNAKDMARPFEKIGGRLTTLFHKTAQRAAAVGLSLGTAGSASALRSSVQNVTAASATSLHHPRVQTKYRAAVFGFGDLRTLQRPDSYEQMDGGAAAAVDGDSSSASGASDVNAGSRRTSAESAARLLDDTSNTLAPRAPSKRKKSLASPPVLSSTPVHSSTIISGGSGVGTGTVSATTGHMTTGGAGATTSSASALLRAHTPTSTTEISSTSNSSTPTTKPTTASSSSTAPTWFPFRGRLCSVAGELRLECSFGRDRLSTYVKVSETLQLLDRLCAEWLVEDGGKLAAYALHDDDEEMGGR